MQQRRIPIKHTQRVILLTVGLVLLFGDSVKADYDYGTVTVTAAPPPAPVAVFTASPASGNAPLTVSFTNQSTGNPTSYSWNFGDGATTSEENPIWTYAAVGTYTVQLTVTNAGGSSTATRTITVTSPPPAAPTAAFKASFTSGNAPLTVSFTNQSTGSPTSYSWNFGDGGTSAETNPTYTYTKIGTYTVQLTATNAGGSSTATGTITMTAPSVAPLRLSVTELAMGDTRTYSTSQKKFNIRNTGQKSITVTLSFDGADASQFLVAPAAVAIGAGRKTSFTVRFTPTSAGSKSAVLRVKHNAGGDPLSLVLRGKGIQRVSGELTSNSFTATANPGPLAIGPASKAAAPDDGAASDRPAVAIQPRLLLNHPNPFNAETTITYNLDAAAEIRLTIHSLTGQLTRILVQGNQLPGRHSVVWDGKDESGRTVGSGIYFYHLETSDGLRQTRRMLLLK